MPKVTWASSFRRGYYPDAMSAALPPPMPTNPLRRVAKDLRRERQATVPFPPGELRPSLARTRRAVLDPLPEMLRCYHAYGPVFTIRVLHAPVTMMLGPEANHYMLVSNAKNFVWREGSMGDLIPLIGDGLLTIDGLAHKTARRLLLPAFHHEQVAKSVDTMVEEIDRDLTAWGRGGETRVDVYDWSRHLALRIAMRALLGIDPDSRAGGHDPAEEWEAALGYYGRDLFVQSLRGPLTPWARMIEGHRRLTALVTREIEARRRGDSEAAERGGIVSMLIEARDDDGQPLSDEAIRDHVLTLLFAGHDTTTATITFMLYELARNPHELGPLRDELDSVVGDRLPTAEDLARNLPRLEMAVDETLRLYPPAWIGPRRSVDPFVFDGKHVPGGVHVNYCSWASHRIPDVFPDPDAFVPDRFAPEEKAKLPKGAYVPFGGGSRTCIGMRFGQMEVKAIAAMLLQRFDFGLQRGYRMRIRQTPTLGPRDGLPVAVRPRA
jgi:cytochrome P450